MTWLAVQNQRSKRSGDAALAVLVAWLIGTSFGAAVLPASFDIEVDFFAADAAQLVLAGLA